MSTSTCTSQDAPKPTQQSSRKRIPTWLPVSLLVVTTAALAVPIVMLHKQRSRAMLDTLPPRRTGHPSSVASRFPQMSSSTMNGNEHQNQWPPPRRTGRNKSSQNSQISPRALPASTLLTPAELDELRTQALPNHGFNAPLDGAKAFGLATLIVAVCASAIVWGLKTNLGVKDTPEFADRMRHLVLTNFPALSERIHRRSPDEDDGGEGADLGRKWVAAEEDTEGLYARARAAMTDLEHGPGQASKETDLHGDNDNNHT